MFYCLLPAGETFLTGAISFYVCCAFFSFSQYIITTYFLSCQVDFLLLFFYFFIHVDMIDICSFMQGPLRESSIFLETEVFIHMQCLLIMAKHAKCYDSKIW